MDTLAAIEPLGLFVAINSDQLTAES